MQSRRPMSLHQNEQASQVKCPSKIPLGNEILAVVFQFVVAPQTDPQEEHHDVFNQFCDAEYKDEDSVLGLSQLLVLRCVCSQFRNVVDQMSVWYFCQSKLEGEVKHSEVGGGLICLRGDFDGKEEIIIRCGMRRFVRDII